MKGELTGDDKGDAGGTDGHFSSRDFVGENGVASAIERFEVQAFDFAG